MRRLLPLFVMILALSSPAQAAIDDQGAAKLKSIFTDILENQRSIQGISGGQLTTNGEVQVEQKGSYYAVTLPGITTIDTEGNQAKLGKIAINAVPGDTEGTWKMSVALPSPIAVLDKAGNPYFTMSFGGQRMAGIYHEEFVTFTKLDAAYENVEVKDNKNAFTIQVPKLSIKSNLEETQPGLYSGPAKIIMTGAKAINDRGLTLFSIGSLNMDANIIDTSIEDRTAMLAKVEELSAGPNTPTPEAFFEIFKGSLESLGNGFEGQYTLKDIKAYFPAKPAQNKKEMNASFDEITFGMDATGFRDNNLKVALRAGYNGMKIDPQPEGFNNLSPRSMNFDVALNDIPYNELISLARNSIETASTNPQAAQMAQVQAMMALPQLMTAANTNLSINDLSFTSDAAKAEFEGRLTANAAAVTGATGAIDGEIHGLKAVMDEAQNAAMAAKDSGKRNFMADVFPVLVLLRGTAEETTDEDGNTVSKFHITLDEQGQVMINDTNIQSLMGAGQGQMPMQEPPVQ